MTTGDCAMPRKTIVLTFDDACSSHLSLVVPLLKELGFGATFFISRPAMWSDNFPGAFLDGKEISEIYHAGFEIGNHTLNHLDLRSKNPDDSLLELEAIDDFLAEYGMPKTVSFAYPGGPYAANAVPVLQKYGLRYARTTEHGVWNNATDPMRIPCYAVCDKDLHFFDEAINMAENNPEAAAVILYHGIPDDPHPWCSTTVDHFKSQMKYLKDNDFRVVSMADFGKILNPELSTFPIQ